MIESGSGSRLAAKSFKRLRVLSNLVRKEFQGDEATKLGVFSLVDNADPAASKFRDDAVVRDGRPDQLGRGSHWRECYAAICGRGQLRRFP